MESTQASSPFRVTIIGAGAVGGFFGHRFKDAGHHVTKVISKSISSARNLAADLNSKAHSWTSVRDLSDEEIIVVAVPDDEIEAVVKRLSVLKLNKGALVFHCSGSKSSSSLVRLESRDIQLSAIHPLRSITRGQFLDIDSKLICGIDAEKNGSPQIDRMIDSLNIEAIWIKEENKVQYHLVATILSNFTVALHGFAADILLDMQMEGSNIELHHFGDLVAGSLKNIEDKGPSDALTGPIVRGDLSTLGSHLEILKSKNLDLLKAYTAMAQLSLRLAIQRNTLSEEKAFKIQEMLIQFGSKEE